MRPPQGSRDAWWVGCSKPRGQEPEVVRSVVASNKAGVLGTAHGPPRRAGEQVRDVTGGYSSPPAQPGRYTEGVLQRLPCSPRLRRRLTGLAQGDRVGVCQLHPPGASKHGGCEHRPAGVGAGWGGGGAPGWEEPCFPGATPGPGDRDGGALSC